MTPTQVKNYLTKQGSKVQYIGETKKVQMCLMSIEGLSGTGINFGRKIEGVDEIIFSQGSIGEITFIDNIAMIYFPELKKQALDKCNRLREKDYLYIRKDAYFFPLYEMFHLIKEVE